MPAIDSSTITITERKINDDQVTTCSDMAHTESASDTYDSVIEVTQDLLLQIARCWKLAHYPSCRFYYALCTKCQCERILLHPYNSGEEAFPYCHGRLNIKCEGAADSLFGSALFSNCCAARISISQLSGALARCCCRLHMMSEGDVDSLSVSSSCCAARKAMSQQLAAFVCCCCRLHVMSEGDVDRQIVSSKGCASTSSSHVAATLCCCCCRLNIKSEGGANTPTIPVAELIKLTEQPATAKLPAASAKSEA